MRIRRMTGKLVRTGDCPSKAPALGVNEQPMREARRSYFGGLGTQGQGLRLDHQDAPEVSHVTQKLVGAPMDR